MDFGSIYHRSALSDCYALNEDEVVINLRTGKDVTAVDLIHEDPFAGGAMGFAIWDGKPEPMHLAWELKYHNIWSVTLRPKYKREQYYFSITAGDENLTMFEDGFYTWEESRKKGRLRQYYRFPWVNASDILKPPGWVNDTVWYQIMPDRFCRGDMAPKRVPLRAWDDTDNQTFRDFYGGDLKGIREKLPYLKELGVTGIYTTPFFLSNSNHKYNTFSYELIDPDFGTEQDMIDLVETAHSLGIRVMMDAVFNHCGTEFAPWKDVLEKGPESPYWDWFFVYQWPLPQGWKSTEDGRFFTFAFTSMMPKLNTNNPEVIEYFLNRCKYWAEHWHIDGIRFDVGNEVSHTFLKALNAGLKEVNPELFLLGEIWHDSPQWLQGDEYHSVMNYPFMESMNNFSLDHQDAKELMYSLNRCYTLYPKQANYALFNFLDTHDTLRALTRCGSKDVFYQQLSILLTMPGSACIYYGTELAMEAENDNDARKPMPWDIVESGARQADFDEVKALIALRKAYPQLRRGEICWKLTDEHSKLVRYERTLEGTNPITVYINTGDYAVSVADGKVLFSRNLEGASLLPGGVAIVEGLNMTLNGKEYTEIKLLGKGKGGYSYLVTDGQQNYVLKQIHHEPCDYYTFGDKLASELNDYQRLREVGIPMPRLLEVDHEQERILKEYIDGDTVNVLVREGRMQDNYLQQMRSMCEKLYAANLNIDYYPTNFVVEEGLLYYIDYECNQYSDQWNFENWGCKYWSMTEEFKEAFCK